MASLNLATFFFIKNQSVKFDLRLTVGSTPDALAYEQALHLRESREVTRELRAKGDACLRGGERLLAGNRQMTLNLSVKLIALCKGLWIPESGKFLLLVSGIRENFAGGI